MGPISEAMGLGYWWVCQVRVATADRGEVEAVVDRSIVTKDDVGTTVELREACFGGANPHCGYGKAVNLAWKIYAGLLKLVVRVLVLLLLVSSVFYLVAGIAGAPRFLVLFDWWQRKVAKSR